MQETTLTPEQNEIQLTDKQIFTKIWTSPRMVFKYINDNNYDKYVKILLVLAGIARAFDRAMMKDRGDDSSLLFIILSSIIIGGLLGWLTYYIYSGLISLTGDWLGGQGNTHSILRVFSYALIPSIIALLIIVPQISVYGIELFKSNGNYDGSDLIKYILLYGGVVMETILGLWTIVLVVIAISEVQKISIGYAILNLLLPILFIVVPIILIVFISSMF